MYYKIMELISKHDDLNLFTDTARTHNLTSITQHLGKYTSISSLETDITSMFRRAVSDGQYNSIYAVEGDRLLRFSRRVFGQARDIKREECRRDYTDDVIGMYGRSLETFVDGVSLVNEHVNFVLR